MVTGERGREEDEVEAEIPEPHEEEMRVGVFIPGLGMDTIIPK